MGREGFSWGDSVVLTFGGEGGRGEKACLVTCDEQTRQAQEVVNSPSLTLAPFQDRRARQHQNGDPRRHGIYYDKIITG